jgi:hypothetical protein
MHKLALALFLLAALTLQTAAQENQTPPRHMHVATTCFLVGEEQSRTDKICHYRCAGSNATIIINSLSLCPLSIDDGR